MSQRQAVPKPPSPDIAECKKALKVLFNPGQVVELRAKHLRWGVTSGYYDNHEKLATDIILLSANPLYSGIYWSLQGLNPALIARSPNKYQERAKTTTSDKDVLCFAWLLVDLDPDRPSDISSNDIEKELAHKLAQNVYEYFKTEYGYDAIVADSGNGYHVLVRIDLPASDAGLVQRVLQALAQRFDTDAVHVDKTVFNAARISKCYGSIGRKGDNTADRPHRLARLVYVPETITTLRRDVLEQIAAEAKPSETKQGTSPESRAEKLESYMAKAGIAHGPRTDYKDGVKWQLKECPFNPEHKSPDSFVSLAASGAMGFCCKHDSCYDTYHWAEFKKYGEEKSGEKWVFVEQPTASPLSSELDILDMPESVLDGILGECCRKYFTKFPIAYAWPAVLTAASVYVKPHERNRCNLFAALVGDVHTSKSVVVDAAARHFRLNDFNIIEETKFGSAEGLVEKIGDRGGMPLLWNPDELAHTLMKAQIENASFTMILNTALYRDKHSITVQHRKQLAANARLSIIGGVVKDRFEDCFGAETTGGLYDRFIFGLCPSGFSYLYRPIEDEPFIDSIIGEGPLSLNGSSYIKRSYKEDVQLPGNTPDAPTPECFVWSNVAKPTPRIDSSVWDARDTIQRDESLEGRVLELAIRAALVCAAWDGREVLRAADLGPAWEFARYQTKVRKFLAPNPGKNYDAQASFKIREYLKAHSGDGQWYAQRDVVRATHAWEYGSATVNRAIDAMDLNGDIEKFIVKPAKGGRIKVLLRYATGF